MYKNGKYINFGLWKNQKLKWWLLSPTLFAVILRFLPPLTPLKLPWAAKEYLCELFSLFRFESVKSVAEVFGERGFFPKDAFIFLYYFITCCICGLDGCLLLRKLILKFMFPADVMSIASLAFWEDPDLSLYILNAWLLIFSTWKVCLGSNTSS